MKLHGTMAIKNNYLEIGGVSVADLKEEYGTPLYVMDQALIEDQSILFRDSFQGKKVKGEVAYASKAFINLAMARLIKDLGLSVDVASGGELHTVYKAGFPMEKVIFHGNNKLDEEIVLAIKYGCGSIVIDHRQEVQRLERILSSHGATMNVYLRINPGIEAHTHEYIKTTTNDSKFGESIYDEAIMDIVSQIAESKTMDLQGFHCHIGSQIFGSESFVKAADEVLTFYQRVKEELNIVLPSMNLGGGFGVYYVEGDAPIDLGSFLRHLILYIEDEIAKRNLDIHKVVIEPGRSIVCNAGSTLYTVGGTKNTYGGKNYVYIDGGMSDNPRPALYQAEYEAILANRALDENTTTYSVAGKLCESGDVIIRNIDLPQAKNDDLLLVSSTGAYTYSMSSNYNRLQRPAVVFVKGGKSTLAVKRQSLDDLLIWDQ